MYKETIKLDNTKYKDFSVITTEDTKAPQKSSGRGGRGTGKTSGRPGGGSPKKVSGRAQGGTSRGSAGRLQKRAAGKKDKAGKQEARTSKWLEKRRKKRSRRLKAFAIIFVILLASFMTVYFLFVIKTVRVTGNEFYEDEVISEMVLRDKYSWNSLYVYLTTRFLPGEKMPFIDSVEVKLLAPDSIEIKVYEKPTIGCIYVDGTGHYAYFDKDGLVCELSSDLMDGVPQIYGVRCFNAELYDEIELEDSSILKTLLLLVVDLDKYDIPSDDISFIRSNIMLQYDDITVNVGSADKLTEKLMRLSRILPELDGMTGTLHMETWSEENTDIIFKKENK